MLKIETLVTPEIKALKVSSKAFRNNEPIPLKYTPDGTDTNPPIDIEGIPPAAKSLAIIVEDVDAPSGTRAHWIVWNIPATHHIKEDFATNNLGLNDFREHLYRGPCPASGTHHYLFKIYGLDTVLELPYGSSRNDLEKAMNLRVVAYGELMGVYSRNNLQ